MRGIDWVRDGYGAIVARLVRFSVIGLVMVGAAMAGVWGPGEITPTGFLSEDDQGAFFVVVQLPDGDTDVVRQIEDILKQETAIADYSATTCCRTPAVPVRRRWLRVLRGLLVAANQDPKLNRVFSTF
jgi:multidrug efflux pump subunit AcrB